MTSRRQRRINRANSVAGLLRQAQAEARMSSPLDAARWRPDDPYAYSPWEELLRLHRERYGA